MRKKQLFLIVGLLSTLAFTAGGSAGTSRKIAQTGFQFLSVNSDGRASALAGAVTALELESSSMFFNPAGMANMRRFIDIALSDNPFIADIHHYNLSLAIRPAAGRYGVVGFSMLYVNYGEVEGTIVDSDPNNQDGFIRTEILTPNAYAFGISYAKAITDRFSVGGQIKKTSQDLGNSRVPVTSAAGTDTLRAENGLAPLAFDFGTQFKTGLKSLVFGMSVRNFSQEVKYAREGFQLPLVFSMGISMNLLDLLPKTNFKHSLMMSIDATHDRSHTSKASEHVLIGLDYRLLDALSFRSGYVTGEDLNAFSFGAGFSWSGLAIDYSYTPYDLFTSVQRMTARISM
jgi:hypothetical protein